MKVERSHAENVEHALTVQQHFGQIMWKTRHLHKGERKKMREKKNLILEPKYIEVWGKFLPRGGLSIDPYCNYGKPGTNWEQVAWYQWS